MGIRRHLIGVVRASDVRLPYGPQLSGGLVAQQDEPLQRIQIARRGNSDTTW